MIGYPTIFELLGALAMELVLLEFSFQSDSIRGDLHNCTFQNFIDEMARVLIAITCFVFTISGGFVTVEDFAAVFNDLIAQYDLLAAFFQSPASP